MSTNKIARDDWAHYFDSLSNFVEGTEVEIDVLGREIGAQVEVKSVALQGLNYDQKDKVFTVITPEFEHLIQEPEEIYVDYRNDELKSIKITAHDGNVHIVKLSSKMVDKAG
ncbi:MAG: hypothetical protein ACI8R9_001577 [Paraglaciecola sp.]|jgi:hypothetical protein